MKYIVNMNKVVPTLRGHGALLKSARFFGTEQCAWKISTSAVGEGAKGGCSSVIVYSPPGTDQGTVACASFYGEDGGAGAAENFLEYMLQRLGYTEAKTLGQWQFAKATPFMEKYSRQGSDGQLRQVVTLTADGKYVAIAGATTRTTGKELAGHVSRSARTENRADREATLHWVMSAMDEVAALEGYIVPKGAEDEE